ncbi:cysteine--tRNA ligase [Chloroflexota bacterium]
MKVFNTLSGRKEEFAPQSDTVTMYVCGVTVYDNCHIGHAMSYVIFDAIKRYLEFTGYKVRHVQNFTDIDDKIINRAQQLGISAKDLAEKYIEEYFEDMEALNIKRADIYPKATEEISKIIDLIKALIANDYAYESKGSVYFRVNNFSEYGKLSHQNRGEMLSKASDTEEKESPLDFALWKASKEGEPYWTSHWGHGRPGWHIECSAMSLKYLGNTIDIHGGGQDLIFPHHENEITQSESFTGKVPFVKYWLHNGLLQLSGDKMSKSLGNLVTIKETLQRFSPDAIRLFILSSHYRSPLTYSQENVEAAETGIRRLRQAAANNAIEKPSGIILDSEPFKTRFLESMDDDFNTAQAIGTLFDLAREINRVGEERINTGKAQQTLTELSAVLGFTLEEQTRPPLDAEPFIKLLEAISNDSLQVMQWQSELAANINHASQATTEQATQAETIVELLVKLRNKLRQVKQWQLADTIRNKLSELGITLEDKAHDTRWYRSR